jgi:AraC-like DNA-binding protein
MFGRTNTTAPPPDAAGEAAKEAGKDSAQKGGAPAGLVLGENSLHYLREGVFLRCVDLVHPRSDVIMRATLQGKCVKVLLKLEGSARARLGRLDLPMDAGRGKKARPKGAVLCLERPEKFECRCPAGERQRLVVVTLTAAWFASGRQLAAPALGHLEARCWTPAPRAVAIAEQLLAPTAFQGPMRGLYLESRSLELVAEALALTASPDQAPPPDLRPDEYARTRRLRDLLDSGHADALSLAEIAREMCCNVTTLQRQFRLVFGTTIFDYLRVVRLRRAAWALQHEGTSVARAAELAGYASQANFSTAFRRHFGLPPKAYRTRI